jgi:multiple sugar transport system permease protein/putative aldouronate transport system permease protein
MVVTMYFNAGLIPWFTNMQMLGLTNNYLAYIIPGIVNVFNIIMVKTYIESIPKELEESAAIDGAPTMVVFRRIIWPLSKPILATIAVWSAVINWNSFTDSLILMSATPKLYTLQHRLWIYLNTTSNLQALMSTNTVAVSQAILEGALNAKVIKYTIAMVSAIPILLVYPFMQRYFEKGIMLGAVKG